MKRIEGGKGKMSTTMTAIRLADIFSPETILLGVKQRTKQAVIAELVRRLIVAGHVEAANEAPLVQLILAREELGSTALGNCIAMPHCRTSLSERFMGAIAIDANGVDFGALDRQPVHLVFLLLAPLEQRERLFDILGRISSLRQDKTIRTQFRGCRSRDDVIEILEEMDRSHE
jgi:mannitol/fructose-specific phosphotransferase system IIA component (Ntr-type)